MKKIKPGIRLGELDTLSDLIIRLYREEQNLPKDDYLNAIMEDIASLSAKLTTAIKRDRIVSNFNELNEKRNEIISNLKQLVSGYAVIPTSEKREYAQKLLTILNKYKGITKKSSREKSSYIESMLEELLVVAPLEQANILEGVSYQIMMLRNAQDEYNKTNDAFLNANASKADSASQVKKQLLQIINNRFLNYMNTITQIDTITYSHFLSKLDIEIDKLNNLIVSRTKNKTEDTEIKTEDSL